MARRLNPSPSLRLGRRPAGPRTDAVQRIEGPGLASATRTHRGVRPVLPGGIVRRAAGSVGAGPLCRAHAFQGDRALSQGTDRPAGVDGAGQSNAETSEDSTHYWFAFPSERWELALAIEADRMHGARFDPGEVEVERRVIGEERARELNSPQGRLDQTHLALTYLRHPYRNPILGWPDDIARIGVDDLVTFYQTHYRPDGAVLVVVGDVDPERPWTGSPPLRGPAGGHGSPTAADGRRAAPDRSPRLRAVRVGVGGPGPLGLAHRSSGTWRRPGAGRPRRSALLRPAVAALAVPGRDRTDGHLDRGGARHGAPRRAVLHPGRGGLGGGHRGDRA